MSSTLGGAPETFRIYAWNATHGGGERRAPDEYRVQFTGNRPEIVPGQRTIVLGWSEKFQVFAGWDARTHKDRDSASPSLQIRQATLEAAQVEGLAAAVRNSGDIVVAISPDFLPVYFCNADALHQDGSPELVEELNKIPKESPTVTAPPEEAIGDTTSRQQLVRTIRTNYRAWDFGLRVRRAYGDMCAICGLQLGLVEAAHIVPVAWPGSTDATSNGIALCRNHHRAYDSAILNFSDDMHVLVAQNLEERFGSDSKLGGIEELRGLAGERVANLPSNESEHPLPENVANGRAARGW